MLFLEIFGLFVLYVVIGIFSGIFSGKYVFTCGNEPGKVFFGLVWPVAWPILIVVMFIISIYKIIIWAISPKSKWED